MSHGLETDRPTTRDQILGMRGLPTHIVGAASAEGVAVLRLLLSLGFEEIVVHDMRSRSEIRKAFRTTHGAYSRVEQDEIWERLRPTFDQGKFEEKYLEGIDQAALVVLGQGWYLDPSNREKIRQAVTDKALITSMVDLYFSLHRGPIVGITGTNGKSTTVAMVEHLLAAAGIAHRTAGNERSNRQFLPEIESISPDTLALLEVSNRQLLQTSHSPHVAAIVSLTPDHLDEHGGMAGYEQAKQKLFDHQKAGDIAIVNADDERAMAIVASAAYSTGAKIIRCGIRNHTGPSVLWRDGVLVAHNLGLGIGEGRSEDVVIASLDDVRVPGDHNLRNWSVAVGVALACGAGPDLLGSAIATFEGKSLRLEKLSVIDGVEVWSDLKSTTPEATMAALDALDDGRIMLICGGSNKGLSYGPLASTIAGRQGDIQIFAVPGSASDELECELMSVDEDLCSAKFKRVADVETALDEAFGVAVSGDRVMVSPAAAGFWSSQLQGRSSLRSLIRQRATVPER